MSAAPANNRPRRDFAFVIGFNSSKGFACFLSLSPGGPLENRGLAAGRGENEN
jgi:hypothetical protein